MKSSDAPLRDPIRIPQGVADYFWGEAYTRRRLENTLLDSFRRWGYGDVVPPTFEFVQSLSTQANADLQAEMYRFLDRDGSTLALRPEMTTSVARLVGTRLHDWPMPQRFCYAGSVFRYTELQAGRQREFFQAGVELIGAHSPEADAEVLALTVAALRAVGLADFRLVVGQIQYFRALLAELCLPPAQQEQLRQAVDRKSHPELASFLAAAPLGERQRQAVAALPTLNGAEPEAIIARAQCHCLNDEMQAALENLRAIHALLHAYGVADTVDLDLTEIRNLGYYTGITFEALVPGLGYDVANGGRYDDLIAHFGPPQWAVGVALGIDRIVLALQGKSRSSQPQPIPPHRLVSVSHDPSCLAIVAHWRAQGLRVAVDVMGRRDGELWAYAQRIGVTQALTWTGSGFMVYEGVGQGQAAARFLPAAECLAAIERGELTL